MENQNQCRWKETAFLRFALQAQGTACCPVAMVSGADGGGQLQSEPAVGRPAAPLEWKRCPQRTSLLDSKQLLGRVWQCLPLHWVSVSPTQGSE